MIKLQTNHIKLLLENFMLPPTEEMRKVMKESESVRDEREG